MSDEIIIEVEPLFNKDKKKECVCCLREHIFSWNRTPDYGAFIYDIISKKTKTEADYKKRKFKIVVEELNNSEVM